MNRIIGVAAFAVGLAVVAWVGTGYVGSSPLALLMTVLIGVVFTAGAAELFRFQRATDALVGALGRIPVEMTHPGEWLGQLPPVLQNPVRLRIEGERAGLPGPALTPYLVGLLVLLGMLGTFLGMVVTLNGAVAALETTTDLHAIRSALAAPVKGLGVAFGTSVAGVAASAMLGLMSALSRRARQQASQLLDTRIATDLRAFSLVQQRQDAFAAMQTQAGMLPALVDRLDAMMAQMEQRHGELGERVLEGQARFHREAGAAYEALAASVGGALKDSLAESARLAGETIEPAVLAAMEGIARQTTALHVRVSDEVSAQLEGLSVRFDAAVTTVAETWTAALARHEDSSARLQHGLQGALASHVEQLSSGASALLASVTTAHEGLRADLETTTSALTRETGVLHARFAETAGAQLEGLSSRFAAVVTTVAETWTAALAHHERGSTQLTTQMQTTLEAFSTTFAQRSDSLIETFDRRAAALQAELAQQETARLEAQRRALQSVADTLQQEWQQVGAGTLAQQERICVTLGETAREISADVRAQASSTIEEAARLMHSAAEAPRVAAEVIGELRQELSASMARDNALLDERSRIMDTLGTLLDAINHAASGQREAIDTLVASAASMLEGAGERFATKIDTDAGRMDAAADRIAGSAVEVASMGEAFGFAVERFSESNDKLMIALQRMEGSLDKASARSDDQLAYYVAQAREIIDLSIMSQKQVVDELQRLSGPQSPLADGV